MITVSPSFTYQPQPQHNNSTASSQRANTCILLRQVQARQLLSPKQLEQLRCRLLSTNVDVVEFLLIRSDALRRRLQHRDSHPFRGLISELPRISKFNWAFLFQLDQKYKLANLRKRQWSDPLGKNLSHRANFMTTMDLSLPRYQLSFDHRVRSHYRQRQSFPLLTKPDWSWLSIYKLRIQTNELIWATFATG